VQHPVADADRIPPVAVLELVEVLLVEQKELQHQGEQAVDTFLVPEVGTCQVQEVLEIRQRKDQEEHLLQEELQAQVVVATERTYSPYYCSVGSSLLLEAEEQNPIQVSQEEQQQPCCCLVVVEEQTLLQV